MVEAHAALLHDPPGGVVAGEEGGIDPPEAPLTEQIFQEAPHRLGGIALSPPGGTDAVADLTGAFRLVEQGQDPDEPPGLLQPDGPDPCPARIAGEVEVLQGLRVAADESLQDLSVMGDIVEIVLFVRLPDRVEDQPLRCQSFGKKKAFPGQGEARALLARLAVGQEAAFFQDPLRSRVFGIGLRFDGGCLRMPERPAESGQYSLRRIAAALVFLMDPVTDLRDPVFRQALEAEAPHGRPVLRFDDPGRIPVPALGILSAQLQHLAVSLFQLRVRLGGDHCLHLPVRRGIDVQTFRLFHSRSFARRGSVTGSRFGGSADTPFVPG